jgi:hypothetical protein
MERSKITIADMLNESEIVHASTKSNGDLYSEKTVRNWINDLCPGDTDLIPDHFHRCRSIPGTPVKPYHIIQTHKEKISI